MIPFTDEGIEYYHCTYSSTECRTTSGAMSKCATGSFLYLRSPTAEEAYSVSVSFPLIKNKYTGNMVLRVYALVLCVNQENCTASDDTMSLGIEKLDGAFSFSHSFPFSSFESEKQWLKFELKFVAHGFDITVRFSFFVVFVVVSSVYFYPIFFKIFLKRSN